MPLAWTDTCEGHWVAAGSQEVFELARCPHVSNDHDVNNERRGYKGISIPRLVDNEGFRGGMLEMDDPEHRHYRTALNPGGGQALGTVRRGDRPRLLDDHIESGRIDFVDDLANVVPAVLTLAMLGVPLQKWTIYNEPAHASVYTPPDSPDAARVRDLYMAMGVDLFTNLVEIRESPRPGIIDALAKLRIDGAAPPGIELIKMLNLLIGGGFDATTALTAHAPEWLSQHPDQRARLSRDRDALLNPATEECSCATSPRRPGMPAPSAAIGTRCSTRPPRSVPALLHPGARGCPHHRRRHGHQRHPPQEGERLWLSWAMANRDPAVLADPDQVILDRKGNRHFSFGLGVRRCIGSNVARTVFKAMLTAVLDRIPDHRCQAEGTMHYDSIGVIQGMRHLPATFTPGKRLGPGVEETVEML